MKDSQNPDNNIGSCVVCSENIPIGAIKCSKCGSYQDKRRFILQWSGLIAALIAIAPLWGIATSLWNIAFPGKPEINLSAECMEKRIVVHAVNRGGQATALGSPELFVIRGKDESQSKIKLKTLEEDLILKPGDLRKLVFTAVSGGVDESSFPQKGSDGNCNLRISFPVIDFQSESLPKNADCSCPE